MGCGSDQGQGRKCARDFGYVIVVIEFTSFLPRLPIGRNRRPELSKVDPALDMIESVKTISIPTGLDEGAEGIYSQLILYCTPISKVFFY